MASLRTLFGLAGRRPAEYEDRIGRLEERLRHMETLIEGLQDSIHRESLRGRKEIRELQKKTEPGELSKALSRDARERGI